MAAFDRGEGSLYTLMRLGSKNASSPAACGDENQYPAMSLSEPPLDQKQGDRFCDSWRGIVYDKLLD